MIIINEITIIHLVLGLVRIDMTSSNKYKMGSGPQQVWRDMSISLASVTSWLISKRCYQRA